MKILKTSIDDVDETIMAELKKRGYSEDQVRYPRIKVIPTVLLNSGNMKLKSSPMQKGTTNSHRISCKTEITTPTRSPSQSNNISVSHHKL